MNLPSWARWWNALKAWRTRRFEGNPSALTPGAAGNLSTRRDGIPLDEFVAASGAKWLRNCDGNWSLWNGNGLDLTVAVREFFEHFNLPTRVILPGREEEVCLVYREATLLELGLSLNVEFLRRADYRPSGKRCTGCHLETVKQARQDRPPNAANPCAVKCWLMTREGPARPQKNGAMNVRH